MNETGSQTDRIFIDENQLPQIQKGREEEVTPHKLTDSEIQEVEDAIQAAKEKANQPQRMLAQFENLPKEDKVELFTSLSNETTAELNRQIMVQTLISSIRLADNPQKAKVVIETIIEKLKEQQDEGLSTRMPEIMRLLREKVSDFLIETPPQSSGNIDNNMPLLRKAGEDAFLTPPAKPDETAARVVAQDH